MARKDTIYIVCATGIDTYGLPPSLEVYNRPCKTKETAQKIMLSFLEDYYGAEAMEAIKKEYPQELQQMLETGDYMEGTNKWLKDFDEEAKENADFQLNTCTIREHFVEE